MTNRPWRLVKGFKTVQSRRRAPPPKGSKYSPIWTRPIQVKATIAASRWGMLRPWGVVACGVRFKREWRV
jgi:hypothetical protein